MTENEHISKLVEHTVPQFYKQVRIIVMESQMLITYKT